MYALWRKTTQTDMYFEEKPPKLTNMYFEEKPPKLTKWWCSKLQNTLTGYAYRLKSCKTMDDF